MEGNFLTGKLFIPLSSWAVTSFLAAKSEKMDFFFHSNRHRWSFHRSKIQNFAHSRFCCFFYLRGDWRKNHRHEYRYWARRHVIGHARFQLWTNAFKKNVNCSHPITQEMLEDDAVFNGNQTVFQHPQTRYIWQKSSEALYSTVNSPTLVAKRVQHVGSWKTKETIDILGLIWTS